MALYFLHFTREGVPYEDTTGFHADDHDQAIEVAKAIGAIFLDSYPHAGDAMMELQAEGGELIFSSSLSALVGGLQ